MKWFIKLTNYERNHLSTLPFLFQHFPCWWLLSELPFCCGEIYPWPRDIKNFYWSVSIDDNLRTSSWKKLFHGFKARKTLFKSSIRKSSLLKNWKRWQQLRNCLWTREQRIIGCKQSQKLIETRPTPSWLLCLLPVQLIQLNRKGVGTGIDKCNARSY